MWISSQCKGPQTWPLSWCICGWSQWLVRLEQSKHVGNSRRGQRGWADHSEPQRSLQGRCVGFGFALKWESLQGFEQRSDIMPTHAFMSSLWLLCGGKPTGITVGSSETS